MNTLAHPSADAASPYRRATPTLLQAVGERLGGSVAGVARAVWRALETAGERRAARELDDLARRWATYDPELAAHLRRATLHDA